MEGPHVRSKVLTTDAVTFLPQVLSGNQKQSEVRDVKHFCKENPPVSESPLAWNIYIILKTDGMVEFWWELWSKLDVGMLVDIFT